MMRVALDTSVIVSGLATFRLERTAPARILHAWLAQSFDVFISEPKLADPNQSWRRWCALDEPCSLARVSPDLLLSTSSDLRTAAAALRITERVAGIAIHPEGDLVLATGASARADYLVTGGRRLLRPGSFEGVSIIAPGDFARVLDEHDAGASNPGARVTRLLLLSGCNSGVADGHACPAPSPTLCPAGFTSPIPHRMSWDPGL